MNTHITDKMMVTNQLMQGVEVLLANPWLSVKKMEHEKITFALDAQKIDCSTQPSFSGRALSAYFLHALILENAIQIAWEMERQEPVEKDLSLLIFSHN